jgi:hypothetical protein
MSFSENYNFNIELEHYHNSYETIELQLVEHYDASEPINHVNNEERYPEIIVTDFLSWLKSSIIMEIKLHSDEDFNEDINYQLERIPELFNNENKWREHVLNILTHYGYNNNYISKVLDLNLQECLYMVILELWRIRFPEIDPIEEYKEAKVYYTRVYECDTNQIGMGIGIYSEKA